MESSPNRSPQVGLSEAVRLAAVAAVREMLPLWIAEPTLDLKRVIRPAGPGSFGINVESYRGVRTWISFQRKLNTLECLRNLEEVIRQSQPELLGYVSVPGRFQQVGDVASICTHWCRTVADRMSDTTTADAELDLLMTELNGAIATRLLTQEVRTPLTGLKLPEGIHEIALTPSMRIREMSDDEVSELGSGDVTSLHRPDIVSNPVSVALVLTENVPFTLHTEHSAQSIASPFQQEAQEQLSAVLSALHILKQGRVGVAGSYFSINPAILPNLGGHSTHPFVQHPFASMELTHPELNEFLAIHAHLQANVRDEVRIAAGRLGDSENRLSPVDSLLDAAIGLEALLNPNDFNELAFRVALNYAFMGPPSERRSRFDRVRAIQKTRNRVVHGGLNLHSRQAATIHEHAQLAKASLRDALKSFLFDGSLAGNRRLDADFWIDRVLPPTIEAQASQIVHEVAGGPQKP